MHVAFVTSIFPNPAEPTLGMFHRQLAGELRHFCELTVLNPHPWFPPLPAMAPLDRWQKYGRIPRTFTIDGIQALSPKYPMVPAISEGVRPSLMAPALVRAAVSLHASRPVDVVNGLWIYPDGVAAARAARRLGVPLVLTGLGCDINLCLEDAAMRRQILASTTQAAGIIVVSEALKDRLCLEGVNPEKVRVITNGVDTTRFRVRDRRESSARVGLNDDGKKHVLFVGRLAEEKGLLTLIEAFAHLRGRRADVKLHVIGDGPEGDPARARCDAHGMRDDVDFLGARGHDDIASWMAACDLLALPSLREGCPNAVLEALASGRPVVATRVGGVPDLVDDRNGVLVPPLDPEAMSRGLEDALERQWDAAAIRETVSSRSWHHTAAAYAEVFRAACAAGPAPMELAGRTHAARL
jgi:glycosyltransferase involved in cell wall biosynthesis